MAGFLRKKTSKSKPLTPTSASAPSLASTSSNNNGAPLFSRFATSQQQQDVGRPAPRMVSQPMQLAGASSVRRVEDSGRRSDVGRWDGQPEQRQREVMQQAQPPAQRARQYEPSPDASFASQQSQQQQPYQPQQPPVMNGRHPPRPPVVEKPLPTLTSGPGRPDPRGQGQGQGQAPPQMNGRSASTRGGPPNAFMSRQTGRSRTLSLQANPPPVSSNPRQSQANSMVGSSNMSDTAPPDSARRPSTTSNSIPSNAYVNHPINARPSGVNDPGQTFVGANRSMQAASPPLYNQRPPSSAMTDQSVMQPGLSFRTSARSPVPQGQRYSRDSMSQMSQMPVSQAGSIDWNGATPAQDWKLQQALHQDQQQYSSHSPPPDAYTSSAGLTPMIDRRQSQASNYVPNGVAVRGGPPTPHRQVIPSATLVPSPSQNNKHRTLTKLKPKDLASHAARKASPPPPGQLRGKRPPSPTLPSVEVPPEDLIMDTGYFPPGRRSMSPSQPTNRRLSTAVDIYPNNSHPYEMRRQMTSPPPPPSKSPSLRMSNAPVQGKPRIFAAMAEVDHGGQPSQPTPPQMNGQGPPMNGGWTNGAQMGAYSPPPPEPMYSQPMNQPPPPQARYTSHPPPQARYGSPPLQPPHRSQSIAGNPEPSLYPSSVQALNGNYYPNNGYRGFSPPPPGAGMDPNHSYGAPAMEQGFPPQSPPRNKLPPGARSYAQTSQDFGPRVASPNGNGHNPSQPPVSPPRPLPQPTPSASRQQHQHNHSQNSVARVRDSRSSLLDDDPFAKVEGVRMLKPTSQDTPYIEGYIEGDVSLASNGKGQLILEGLRNHPPREHYASEDGASMVTAQEDLIRPNSRTQMNGYHPSGPMQPLRREGIPEAPPEEISNLELREDRPPEPFPLQLFLSDPLLLSCLLSFFSFYDWCLLSGVSKDIRIMLVKDAYLREAILERFLKTVGYSRWIFEDPEPLALSLQDLHDYMRGVSTPTHEYARVADMYVHSLKIHPTHRDPSLNDTVRQLTASTRAYTRVVLRLRAQAEKETSVAVAMLRSKPGYNSPARGLASRTSSRAPSPSRSWHSHSNSRQLQPSPTPLNQVSATTFRSPLFRLRRAPLLRVFVPSPEGDWLSDKSVLECESECRRAGVMHLLRLGDVVWDVAVGDEGNVGRLVWDGMYLIDLDYTYTPVGDLPKYLPSLAFPPSYFHRVIRTGPSTTNPIAHIDIRPWGEEIASNLQLIQDRVRTETPQGAYHNVVRWVHRSSFVIRPPGKTKRYSQATSRSGAAPNRIQIPESNLFVDSGWYGTVMVETEGTNESLADLQARCGPGAFPPRHMQHPFTQREKENQKVFRVLREKSRPGEIWIRAVNVKERLI
ncbi:hypothetical protein BDN72DRAFT_844319 [Pluteus cervinus]|uniref:Uncharacterized protein n=1 Tax=Pluteus cervinus TaxID=181527 RepID=A0ACD3ALE9_9AGAR|nr:hypothetical protein BDN72DRAFT_844319 [Pluteus cervinus]